MGRLCALLLCSLSACATLNDLPNDIRLVDLRLEEGPYKSQTLEEMKEGEIIDIEVTTNLSYTNFANGSYVFVEFHFCDQMDTEVIRLGGISLYLYDKKWISVSHGEGNENSGGPYHYHAGMRSFTHGKEPISKGPWIFYYDLRESPRDVCFYLSSFAPYAIVGEKRSNVVRIPKEMLIKFFAEHPRRVPSEN